MRYPSPSTVKAILESYNIDTEGLTDEYVVENIHDFMTTLQNLSMAEEQKKILEKQYIDTIATVNKKDRIEELRSDPSSVSQGSPSYH